jgi:hypothetical protein
MMDKRVLEIWQKLETEEKVECMSEFLLESNSFRSFLENKFINVIKCGLNVGDAIRYKTDYEDSVYIIHKINPNNYHVFFLDTSRFNNLEVDGSFEKIDKWHVNGNWSACGYGEMKIYIAKYEKVENVVVAEVKAYFANGKPKKNPELRVAVSVDLIKQEKIRLKSVPFTAKLDLTYYPGDENEY